MLRIVLQRFALQRSIAEQLEAVPLDEVLRRMQSSSLSNPARSLEAHFVLAEQSVDEQSSSQSRSSSSSAETPSGGLLRHALSERLLVEVRRDITTPHLNLDSGSLMLANCLRHKLSPLATQQIFALWLRFMHRGAGPRSSGSLPVSGFGSFSIMGLGRSAGGYKGGEPGSSAQGNQLLHFQSLVRVLEACLDAQEQQQFLSGPSGSPAGKHAMRAIASASQALQSSNPVCFTLDDWAELIDTVEQYWPLFIDHGASTTGLLVQFTALALELTSNASSTPATAEPESRFANSLRRLSHLQTDRALLQKRVLGLCAEAVKALPALERAEQRDSGDGSSYQQIDPWWHRPQEMVRLSQARRRIEAHELGQLRRADWPSSNRIANDAREPFGSEAGISLNPASFSPAQRTKVRETPGTTVRGTRVGTHGRPALPAPLYASTAAAASSASAAKSRWPPLLSGSWWPSASPFSSAAGTAGNVAAQRSGAPSARVGKQLGVYVTYHALRQTATASHAPSYGQSVSSELSKSSQGTGRGSAPISTASFSVSLRDVLEIFTTVCSAASSSGALEDVTTFSWWVRDVVQHQHGRRSLHDAHEMTSLLGIAELCLTYPDGTQTVLAEIMKALQRSALFLWQVGETSSASHFSSMKPPALNTLMLWPRACEVVANALPLTAVGTEAERTLRGLVSTAQQALSTAASEPAVEGSEESGVQLLARYRRYGVLVLACLLLQRPNGYVTSTLCAQLQRLVWTVPFSAKVAGPNDLAAAVRALYLFTHKSMSSSHQAEEVVSFLLNQVTRLLSASAATQLDSVEHGVTNDLSRSLASLSTTERHLLRSALRAVRGSALNANATSSLMVENVAFGDARHAAEQSRELHPAPNDLAERSLLSGPSDGVPEKNEALRRQSSLSPALPARATHVSSPRQDTRTRSKGGLGDRQNQRCEQRVLQRELEAVSIHLSQHRFKV